MFPLLSLMWRFMSTFSTMFPLLSEMWMFRITQGRWGDTRNYCYSERKKNSYVKYNIEQPKGLT